MSAVVFSSPFYALRLLLASIPVGFLDFISKINWYWYSQHAQNFQRFQLVFQAISRGGWKRRKLCPWKVPVLKTHYFESQSTTSVSQRNQSERVFQPILTFLWENRWQVIWSSMTDCLECCFGGRSHPGTAARLKVLYGMLDNKKAL